LKNLPQFSSILTNRKGEKVKITIWKAPADSPHWQARWTLAEPELAAASKIYYAQQQSNISFDFAFPPRSCHIQTFRAASIGLACGLISLRDPLNLRSDMTAFNTASYVIESERVMSRIAAFIARIF